MHVTFAHPLLKHFPGLSVCIIYIHGVYLINTLPKFCFNMTTVILWFLIFFTDSLSCLFFLNSGRASRVICPNNKECITLQDQHPSTGSLDQLSVLSPNL